MLIFCFVIAVVGWHYALFSSAASLMRLVETPSTNHKRILLRRVGGSFMAAIAAALVELTRRLQAELPDPVCMMLLAGVLLLIFLTALLALFDLRLTLRMKQQY